jgi:hypothetical protein
MTQLIPEIAPERIKWSDSPTGTVTGWSTDERLFVNPFVAVGAGEWTVVDISVGRARTYEARTQGIERVLTEKTYAVIAKGWRHDTAFLSLWVSNDLVNCHWWITRRDKPETVLARGTCFGFDVAANAAKVAALAELDKCREQVLAVPLLVVTPAKKEQVAA